MEKRINQKTRTYLQQFKNDIKEYVTSKQCINKDITDSLLQFVYDYQPLEFQKTDFQKRKRVKNIVPYFERCCALRANGQQCTRRRKNSDKFCGTHIKGIPHGEINQEKSEPTHTKKTVWAQDIKGIIYYIDDSNNVYHPQDVLNNTVNPKIIAKYVLKEGEYSIPSLSKK
tara:strand:- start:719 stop:1231 length:513 start_codon:yes stop_codon:yes gene_type:complete